MATRPLFADGLLDGLTDGLGDSVGDLGGLGTDSAGGLGAGLPTSEVTAGLKEALRFASERAVGDISVLRRLQRRSRHSYPAARIPGAPCNRRFRPSVCPTWPTSSKPRSTARPRTASGEATDIFWGAVDNMSIEDAEGILNGPDDAATQYFRRETSSDLKGAMRPIVDESLSADVGAIQAYGQHDG